VKTVLKRVWNEDRGVLTFEWILLITLIVLGVVGGLTAARDGLIDELGDVAEAVVNVDQSWSIAPSPCEPCPMDFGCFVDEPPDVERQRSCEPPESP
jgi:hypothetical protein